MNADEKWAKNKNHGFSLSNWQPIYEKNLTKGTSELVSAADAFLPRLELTSSPHFAPLPSLQ